VARAGSVRSLVRIRQVLTNIRAARIGPTVCDLYKPMPIEHRSKTLPAMLGASHASVLRENAGMPTSRGYQPGEVGIGVLAAPCSAQHRFCRGA
jgi:hypothetical protein